VRLAFVSAPSARYAVAHHAAATLVRRCRIALTLEGRELLPPAGPAVIVANHASYVDALALVATLDADVRFAAKRELARAPVLGWALRRLGTYFVDRVDPASGIEDTRELGAAVRRGERILVFPEGTFTRAPGLSKFHLGAFVVSAATGVPVVPVVLKGTRSVLRANQWQPRRHPVTVCILPPVPPDGHDWSAAVRLRDRVRALMQERADEPDLAR
jgi:1-acyl-sn-glycerol-3-phosphate acyltransferase